MGRDHGCNESHPHHKDVDVKSYAGIQRAAQVSDSFATLEDEGPHTVIEVWDEGIPPSTKVVGMLLRLVPAVECHRHPSQDIRVLKSLSGRFTQGKRQQEEDGTQKRADVRPVGIQPWSTFQHGWSRVGSRNWIRKGGCHVDSHCAHQGGNRGYRRPSFFPFLSQARSRPRGDPYRVSSG